MLETIRTGFMPVKAAAALTGGRPLLFLLTLFVNGVAGQFSAVAQPAIEWAAGLGNCHGFNVHFTEPVNPHTATNVVNYQIDWGTVTRVVPLHGTNLQEYVIEVAGSVPADARLTVNGVANLDSPPKVVPPGSTSRVLPASGVIHALSYGAVNGGAPLPGDQLSDLFAATGRFPDFPDAARTLTALESRPGMGSGANSGIRMFGFVVPAITGDYRFFLSAGSQATVYLSASADPEARSLIAVEPAGSPFRDYLSGQLRLDTEFGNASFPNVAPDAAVNRSENTVGMIPLEAGQAYFIEAVMKVGAAGEDHLSIAWEPAAVPGTVTNGAPPIPRQHLALSADSGACPDATIVYADIPELTTEGERVTMQVVAGGNANYPLLFQWFRDGQPIPDATNRTYTIDPVTADMIGARFACRVRNAFGEDSTDPLATAGRPTVNLVHEGGQKFLVWPASYWDFLPKIALELGTETRWDALSGGTLSATELRIPIAGGGPQGFFQAMKTFPASPSPP